MRFSKGIVFIVMFLTCCISPYQVNTNFQQQLVVEGMITDQPGPYLIKLSKTQAVNDQLGSTNAISGANIILRDDRGNLEPLVESSPGNYYTISIQGIVGRSYSISIVLNDGASYESAFETLLPVGDFSLSNEFLQVEPPNANNQIVSSNGFNVYLTSEVLPEQEGRVWWRWTGTFEILTYPKLMTKRVTKRNGSEIVIPSPPWCSGYFVALGLDSSVVGPYWDCTCCTCWVTQQNTVPLISDLQFVNNGKIRNEKIAFVEANVRTFYDKYYLEVEQLSISASVYDFWKNIKTQEQNSSNLFQIPPPKAVGNIVASSKNALPVIGYFAASSIRTHAIIMERGDIPYKLNSIDTLIIDCTQAYPTSTNLRPVFW